MTSNLHSRDAEGSTVGAMILDNECIAGVLEILRADDFYFDDYRNVFSAITSLHAKGMPSDITTITDELANDDLLPLVAEAAKNTPSSVNVLAYADTVRNRSERRQLVQQARLLAQEAHDLSKPIKDTVDVYSTRISSIEGHRASLLQKVGDRLNESFLKPLDDRFSGLVDPMGWSYGVKDLDNQIMGIHEQDLVVIAGRPSMGKTATMNNIVAANLKRATEEGAPIIDFSMEMSLEKRSFGLIASMGRIPISALKNPKVEMNEEYWSKLTYPVTTLKAAPYYMEDCSHSIEMIESKVKQIYETYGKVGLVLVDYLGLMTGGSKEGDSRTDLEVGERVLRLKKIAKDYNTRVVLLSQLSRKVEQRPDKRPLMSDLINSGTIEAAADTIVMLYRDEYYNKENPEVKGIIELIVKKCREGEVGTVYAAAMLAMGLITDLAPKNDY